MQSPVVTHYPVVPCNRCTFEGGPRIKHRCECQSHGIVVSGTLARFDHSVDGTTPCWMRGWIMCNKPRHIVLRSDLVQTRSKKLEHGFQCCERSALPTLLLSYVHSLAANSSIRMSCRHLGPLATDTPQQPAVSFRCDSDWIKSQGPRWCFILLFCRIRSQGIGCLFCKP